jgi:CO dehydrogenase/acetyl-CoA synthase delta subunit
MSTQRKTSNLELIATPAMSDEDLTDLQKQEAARIAAELRRVLKSVASPLVVDAGGGTHKNAISITPEVVVTQERGIFLASSQMAIPDEELLDYCDIADLERALKIAMKKRISFQVKRRDRLDAEIRRAKRIMAALDEPDSGL